MKFKGRVRRKFEPFPTLSRDTIFINSGLVASEHLGHIKSANERREASASSNRKIMGQCNSHSGIRCNDALETSKQPVRNLSVPKLMNFQKCHYGKYRSRRIIPESRCIPG